MTAVRKEHVEINLVDALIASGLAGQAAILEAQLKAGVPIVYQDGRGHLVEEHPDGTITILKTKEQLSESNEGNMDAGFNYGVRA